MPDLFIADTKTAPSVTNVLPEATPNPINKTTNASLSESNSSSLPIRKKPSLFMSYCKFPQGVSFEHQEKNEEIILFLRKHFITNLQWITATLFFFFLPIVTIIALDFVGLSFSLPLNYSIILTIFYYLIVFGYALVNFVMWFYNVGIITRLRVVDVDVTHLTSKNVASTNIADIVDVEYHQKGFLSTVLDYGDIHMQTEGIKPNFEFHAIPHPAKTSDTLSDLIGGRDLNE